MSNQPIYPRDIVAEVRQEWERNPYQRDKSPFPSDELLSEILDTAFCAGMLREELRPLEFRLAFVSTTQAVQLSESTGRIRWIEFAEPRPFTPAEIRRLSPALDPNVSMICVTSSAPGSTAKIPGILTCGSTHEQMSSGAALSGFSLPDLFNVYANEPGMIFACRGNRPLLRLKNGQIVLPTIDIFRKGAIAEQLKIVEDEIHQIACAELKDEGNSECTSDSIHTITLYFAFLVRMLHRMGSLGHGGSMLLLPHGYSIDDSRLADRVRIKYPLRNTESWRSQIEWVKAIRTNLHQHVPNMRDAVTRFPRKEVVSDIHSQLILMADFFAGLTAVDGAVLLTSRLQLLGYGGEVNASSPSLHSIKIATTDNKPTINQSIESYGTRHRSVFRFCSSLEDAIGFIVSQDGGVKVVKRVGKEVVMWQDIVPTF